MHKAQLCISGFLINLLKVHLPNKPGLLLQAKSFTFMRIDVKVDAVPVLFGFLIKLAVLFTVSQPDS